MIKKLRKLRITCFWAIIWYSLITLRQSSSFRTIHLAKVIYNQKETKIRSLNAMKNRYCWDIQNFSHLIPFIRIKWIQNILKEVICKVNRQIHKVQSFLHLNIIPRITILNLLNISTIHFNKLQLKNKFKK